MVSSDKSLPTLPRHSHGVFLLSIFSCHSRLGMYDWKAPARRIPDPLRHPTWAGSEEKKSDLQEVPLNRRVHSGGRCE